MERRDIRERCPAGGGHDQIGTGASGEISTAGDVVVVHVGLEHMGYPGAVVLDDFEKPAEVSLRVNDDGRTADDDDVR